MVDDFFGSYSGGDVAPEIDENVFDPTYGGYFGEVVGENVFDPTYGGYFGEVAGENVFDPTYGGTLPSDTGDGAIRGLSPVPKVGTGGAKTPPPPSSAISSILKQLFVDDKGNLNLKTLAGIGGGLLGAFGANTPNRQKSGYQGSIPKLDAVRNMVTAPPTKAQGYRPGQGGINYGGDVSYVPKGTGLAAAPIAPAVKEEVPMAQGGLAGLAKGRYLQGETDGMADEIPAQIGDDQPAALSHGEFVIPADVVSHLGNGNSDAGAQKLYSMMDKIREARTGSKKQGKEIDADKFMPGGLAKAYANGGGVKQFNTGGTAVSGLGTAANAGVTGSETGPNTWAGEYMSNMLGQGQALANAPYQQYMGPLTAGESGLQSKVFGGLQSMNFPGNLGQSFSSTGAYQPPQLNMGAYQQTPIGTGPQPGMIPQGSPIPQDPAGTPQTKGFGDFGQMPQGRLAGLLSGKPGQGPEGDPNFEFTTVKNLRPELTQFNDQQGFGQQGGLAGLLGDMGQQPRQQLQQPQQQSQGIASQYMNPYLQSVLTPQLEELRRQNEITNMQANAKATGMGAFGGGRQAIMNAENARNLMQEMNKTVGQGYASAYDKGMGQFNIEQAQNMGLARLMADQGAQQRGIEAEGIAADKAAFEAARENPYKMLQFQQSLLQGMPISATNIDMATPTKLQEILSGIGGGVKMVGNKPEDISLKSVTDLLGKLGLGGTPG